MSKRRPLPCSFIDDRCEDICIFNNGEGIGALRICPVLYPKDAKKAADAENARLAARHPTTPRASARGKRRTK